jgi:ATP-dependent exoDNAse (exonuclease V) alpha subunit
VCAQGLCNGAQGVVTDIVYNGKDTAPSLPLFIMVKFDSYKGVCPEGMDAIPIPAMPIFWEDSHSGKFGYIRKGFPLVLGFASTIHKTQGLTMDKMVLDHCNSTFVSHAMLFVALSRVRCLNDIVLLSSFSEEFISNLQSSDGDNVILREDTRLNSLANLIE